MKPQNLFALSCVVFAAGIPVGALAASAESTRPANRPVSTTAETRPALKQADRHFLDNAVKASMEEVEISRVAMERTSNPKVREFARMIVADHEAANDTLALIAANHGVAVPAKNNDTSKWSKKDGKDFDKDYIDKMVSSHEDTVKLFQKEATEGEDVEAVAFARKTLPRLQHHLEQANDLKRLMK